MFIGKFLHFISTSFRSHQHPVENKIANIQKHPVSLAISIKAHSSPVYRQDINGLHVTKEEHKALQRSLPVRFDFRMFQQELNSCF